MLTRRRKSIGRGLGLAGGIRQFGACRQECRGLAQGFDGFCDVAVFQGTGRTRQRIRQGSVRFADHCGDFAQAVRQAGLFCGTHPGQFGRQ